jgi:hypothetical protein
MNEETLARYRAFLDADERVLYDSSPLYPNNTGSARERCRGELREDWPSKYLFY